MNKVREAIIHQLLVENYNKYYRLAYSYVHNEADAMDIVQEGAYKAILKSDTLKNIDYAQTWIYRIIINEALEFKRKNQRDTVDIKEDLIINSDSYANFDLERAIDELPALDKTIIKLRFYEELKIEQIADITNENINTIKSRLYRTLKKLRLSIDM